jgi:outer membrane lipoprotein
MMGRLSISIAGYVLLYLLLGGFTACAPAISKKVREEAGEPVPFEALLKQIDDYKGRVVIVGGYILETVNETDGSRITVLQAPLDSQNRPKSSDLSEGRFMVSSNEFLDPVVYSKERRITVGGKVIGSQERTIRGTDARTVTDIPTGKQFPQLKVNGANIEFLVPSA